MIPIRDNLGPRGLCPVTMLLLIAWVGLFLWQYYLAPADLASFQRSFGLVPGVARSAYSNFSAGSSDVLKFLREGVLPFLTYGLLHGGPLHLLTNVFCVTVLGMRLEAQAGWWRFALFFLACQVLAGVTQVLWHHDPNVVTVGASGALAGVLGAYLVWAFRARVLLLLLPLPLFVEVPVAILAVGWIALQFRPVQEFLSVGGAEALSQPISYLAHGGGLVAGLALCVVLWPRQQGRSER